MTQVRRANKKARALSATTSRDYPATSREHSNICPVPYSSATDICTFDVTVWTKSGPKIHAAQPVRSPTRAMRQSRSYTT
jgi:hypothetical protein